MAAAEAAIASGRIALLTDWRLVPPLAGVQVVVEPRAIGTLWYAFVEGIDGVRTELIQRP